MSDSQKEFQRRQLHLGIVMKPDTKVWRYLDLPKFMAFLETQSLFFCRADLFGDRYEGSFTRTSVDFREKVWRKSMHGAPEEHLQNLFRLMSHRNQELKKTFFINCWHMNEHESAAMWEVYGLRNQTIALQSTCKILRNCLPQNTTESGQPLDGHVDLGLVQYLEYESEPMPQIYSFDPFLRKRKSFAFEQEVRLFYQSPSEPQSYTVQEGTVITNDIEYAEGIHIPVDINTLVQKVHVSPGSPDWYLELVTKICSRYGIVAPVLHSELEGSPIY